MSDIVERLNSTIYMDGSRGIEHDAADEIKWLRAQLAEAQKDAARYRLLRSVYKDIDIDLELLDCATAEDVDARFDKLRAFLTKQGQP